MEFLIKFLLYITFTLFIVLLITLFFLAIWYVVLACVFILTAIGYGIYFGIKKISEKI
jgi:hypothetical protein